MHTPRQLLKRALGLVLFVFGAGLVSWIGYNVVVQESEAFRSAIPTGSGAHALILGVIMTVTGYCMLTRAVKQREVVEFRPARREIHLSEEVDPQTLENARVLLQQGRKIEAIKLVRSATGSGLRDAKLAVDQLKRAA